MYLKFWRSFVLFNFVPLLFQENISVAEEVASITHIKCGSYSSYQDGSDVELRLSKNAENKFKFNLKVNSGGNRPPGMKAPKDPSFSMDMQTCEYDIKNNMLFSCIGIDKVTHIWSVVEEFVRGRTNTIYIEKGKSKTSYKFDLKDKNECQ